MLTQLEQSFQSGTGRRKGTPKGVDETHQQELRAYCPNIYCGRLPNRPPPSVVGLPGVNTYVKWVGKVCACIVDALLFLIWLQKI